MSDDELTTKQLHQLETLDHILKNRRLIGMYKDTIKEKKEEVSRLLQILQRLIADNNGLLHKLTNAMEDSDIEAISDKTGGIIK